MSSDQRTPPRLILVVDDEAFLRMLATEFFEEAGYEVIEAANGSEAMAVLQDHPGIDAVFTDVQMPGEPDGLALARAVRNVCPRCAIVVVSGRVAPGPGDLVEGARFLMKPYDGDQAVRTIQQLLSEWSNDAHGRPQ